MNYRVLSGGVVNDDIYIVSFSQLNDKIQQIALSVLGNICDDEYIVYSSNDNSVTILGKFALFDNNITNSRYYEAFANNSSVIGEVNPTPKLKKAKCLQIGNCVFDISLNNKNYLRRIFASIISIANGYGFIWMDDNDILFYPISSAASKNYASHYFSLMLYNSENAPV